MMPMIRPRYGSWLFWFGLPGLAMLWWLWFDTPLRHFEVKVMWGNCCLRVADSSRLLEIGWTRDSSLSSPLKVEGFQSMRTEDRLFPPALWLSSYGGDHDQIRKWFIAYWLPRGSVRRCVIGAAVGLVVGGVAHSMSHVLEDRVESVSGMLLHVAADAAISATFATVILAISIGPIQLIQCHCARALKTSVST